jgi:RNA polymerase sigma-70 factor, ECF subfamily
MLLNELIESAESAALRRETIAALDVALGGLPPHQRRAIVLHDVAGYSSQEIAQLDGLQHNTVRTRLFRARRAMRRSVAHLLNSATSDTARSG